MVCLEAATAGAAAVCNLIVSATSPAAAGASFSGRTMVCLEGETEEPPGGKVIPGLAAGLMVETLRVISSSAFFSAAAGDGIMGTVGAEGDTGFGVTPGKVIPGLAAGLMVETLRVISSSAFFSAAAGGGTAMGAAAGAGAGTCTG